VHRLLTMIRIDEDTAEFTDAELLVREIHELLLDQGHSQGDAMIMLRGALVPEGLRTPTPLLDAVLTPEFVDWLTT
jgi:hypothetical protein